MKLKELEPEVKRSYEHAAKINAAMVLLKVADAAALDFSEFAHASPQHLLKDGMEIRQRLIKFRTALIEYLDEII